METEPIIPIGRRPGYHESERGNRQPLRHGGIDMSGSGVVNGEMVNR